MSCQFGFSCDTVRLESDACDLNKNTAKMISRAGQEQHRDVTGKVAKGPPEIFLGPSPFSAVLPPPPSPLPLAFARFRIRTIQLFSDSVIQCSYLVVTQRDPYPLSFP